MAVDGVKIIDSDDAYDIYNDITERYKDGEDVEKIKQDWIKEEEHFCIDELYTEIYWTAFAYSLWKIGYLDESIKQKTMAVLSQGASERWHEIDPRAHKQRQKFLDKLIIQLQSENTKPLKKTKLRKQKTSYFQMGDVLAIEMPQGYGVCFVSSVEQTPRKIEYHLACTRLLQNTPPTMTDFMHSKIACTKIDTEFALKTDCWFSHSELGLLLPYLKKIGKVKLAPYKLWILAPAQTLDDIHNEIKQNPDIRELPLMETCKLIESVLEE